MLLSGVGKVYLSVKVKVYNAISVPGRLKYTMLSAYNVISTCCRLKYTLLSVYLVKVKKYTMLPSVPIVG